MVGEERKVVTALFCDLVGFTTSSESADPEDVNVMLAAYSQMARSQIEGHGGVVEKFIGDAVVGVFGVPAAHEDDPERAVRAGLRIVEAAEELEAVGGQPLRLRVGINTGEVLVRLGIAPGSGEGFLRGDAINTASRLQGVAPVMGVAVGEATYEATAVVFDYRELEPAALKGKAEPVRVYQPTAPRARFGTDLTRTHSSPFVGREVDLAILKGVFEKAAASESVQLVSVVGEPGLGKSRLVTELFGYIDDRPGLITWRQGRCLPYGEGITFWALGEILKAHAGILESDSPATATAKLDSVLPAGDQRAWFRQRLLPLLGIEASSSADRGELFTAWRRFLESIAEAHPTVLVFEDLHWADDALLAFLEHLADRAEGVPLLLVGTARPELYERHAGFASGLHNVNRINLSPLTPDETARLVSALLDARVVPVELQQPILDRSGGNPLYAEEFVRLLKDRDLLVRRGSGWALREGAEVPFPDSVRALIAARLDTLSPEHKSMLADAAVVGKVFWAGALAEMGGRTPDDVVDALRELSRKELVRPSRRSSIEGEAEYAFWHILACDVAYAQLPRAARVTRHVAAARWIESRAPARVEDVADVLAYHYSTALDLARAAGHASEAVNLEPSARRFLSLSGRRALGLDTLSAVQSFRRVLDLTPPGHPDRADALAGLGESAFQAGDIDQGTQALAEAIAAFQASGDVPGAARAMALLGNVLYYRADPQWAELPAQAVALLEPLAPSAELVGALTESARANTLQGRHADGIRDAERAISLAGQLGLPRPARALGYRGLARTELGDTGGLDDLYEAIELASELGQGREVGVLYGNLGETLSGYEGPTRALELMRAGIAFAQARGVGEIVNYITPSTLDPLYGSGQLDEALAVAERIEDMSTLTRAMVQLAHARIATLRGELVGAELLTWLEQTTRGAGSPEYAVVGLATTAAARVAAGEAEAAATLLGEAVAAAGLRNNLYYAVYLPALVRTALVVEPDLAAQLLAGYEPRYPVAEHALVTAGAAIAEAAGALGEAAEGYAEAVERWERFGVIPEQAFALLGQGRCLAGLSRAGDAEPVLRRARELFAALGARPALDETDSLLERATARTS